MDRHEIRIHKGSPAQVLGKLLYFKIVSALGADGAGWSVRCVRTPMVLMTIGNATPSKFGIYQVPGTLFLEPENPMEVYKIYTLFDTDSLT